MKNVIKKYSELPEGIQKQITESLDMGSVERINFPYKGEITSGLVHIEDDIKYLVVMDAKKPSPKVMEEDEEEMVFDDYSGGEDDDSVEDEEVDDYEDE